MPINILKFYIKGKGKQRNDRQKVARKNQKDLVCLPVRKIGVFLRSTDTKKNYKLLHGKDNKY